MSRWVRYVAQLLILLWPVSVFAAQVEAKQTLRLGVYDYLGGGATQAQFAPIVEYLNQHLERERIELEVMYEKELAERVEAGTVDFVITNPTQYLSLRSSNRLMGVLASMIESHEGRAAPCIAGVIFVRQDRSDIEDVVNKVVATPRVANFGAFRVQQYELQQRGVLLDMRRVLQVGTPHAVVDAVLSGKADVGFVRAGALENMQANGQLDRSKFRVLEGKNHPRCLYEHTTPTYPGWPVLALEHVDPRAVAHVAAALFALEESDWAAVESGIYGFSVPRDYSRVEELSRALRLPPYDVVPQFTMVDVLLRWRYEAVGVLIALILVLALISLLLRAWRHEAQAHRFVHDMLMAMGQGVYQVDAQGVCRFINPVALALLGVKEGDVLGKSPHVLFHHHYSDGQVYPPEHCPTWKTLRDGKVRREQVWFIRPDGSGFDADMLAAPIWRGSSISGAVVIFDDISERLRIEAQLREMASTDPLTGLLNRRVFIERLQEQIARAQRFATPAAGLMLDCDHFKLVNDRYGHEAGDQVLRRLAEILREHSRATDSVGRLGGEEFAVILDNAELSASLLWAERVRERFASETFSADEHAFHVTISIGVTSIKAEDDENDVLRRADEALYKAKQHGRNRVERT